VTDLPPENTDRPEETPEPVSNGAPVARAAPEREASVRLGTTDERGDAALMDPANESLADALKITFRLVQFSMVILAGLFVFSGFQTVNEGERGVSVLFGKTRAIDLEPGFRFSAPYPFGELVKVQTGTLSPQINRAFWPFVNLGEEDGPVENLPRGRRLNAARDGSLITADLNLAHTQWRVNYRRDRVAEFVTNVIPEAEGAIVRHAVERAIVQAMAETTIDDLLRPEGGTRALAQRVQETAQQMLDEIAGAGPDGVTQGIGVQIEQVDLARKIPPSSLIRQFAAVITARSEAQRARTDAEARRGETLNAVAGTAAGSLLEQIEQYEVVVETGPTQPRRRVPGADQGLQGLLDARPRPRGRPGRPSRSSRARSSGCSGPTGRARARRSR
jgi:regulator of protease activity HflC (stomatin/prohibitin superfamily)